MSCKFSQNPVMAPDQECWRKPWLSWTFCFLWYFLFFLSRSDWISECGRDLGFVIHPFSLFAFSLSLWRDHLRLFVCWAAQWGAISNGAKISKHRESLSLFCFTASPDPLLFTWQFYSSADVAWIDQNHPTHQSERIVGCRCFLSSSPLCRIMGHLRSISPLQIKLICSDLQRVWPPVYVDEPQYSWTHL